MAVPPFPYESVNGKYNPEGIGIWFLENISDDEWNHIHFSEVMQNGYDLAVGAKSGYVMSITGAGDTVEEARENAYRLTDKLFIPKMFYRHDVGLKFIEQDKMLLKKWGYL